MKVNMTPNPLDVVTIHASQGDTEARQWEFELHNNGELIDTSDVKEQLVFKAYKGGTEQLLPENGSTPTTSPFKCGIKYPQGLRFQEFAYRKSPTEEDGLAKITDIKGNTLVWNQLVQNGNFADGTNNWTNGTSSTISASNGELTVTIGGAWNNDARQNRFLVAGHKYLGTFKVKSDTLTNIGVAFGQFGAETNVRFAITNTLSPTYQTVSGIATITESTSMIRCSLTLNGSSYTGQTYTIKDVMLFDLTQMGMVFDSIVDPSEFTSIFSLPYYGYNQGTLLSFNGNGIKTVGKNKFNLTRDINVTLSGVTFKSNADKSITVNGTTTGNATLTQLNGFTVPNIKKGESLIWSGGLNRPVEQAYAQLVYNGDETGQTYSFVSVNNQSVLINATESMTLSGMYISCRSGNTFNNETFYPMLRYANTDSTFEPYTSSTLSLPISTYFPTGMKSAGNVYDELTESKAITRVGQITINGSYDVYLSELTNCVRISLDHGRTDVKYPNSVQASNYLPFLVNFSQDSEHFYMNGGSAIIFILKSKCGTTAESVKAYLNSNPLTIHYELATPTETSFTTASLVTENAEIPLSNEDDVLIGKCTEQLSENPGFIDAKIKLSDADGECYSNKIQLHIERSPQ